MLRRPRNRPETPKAALGRTGIVVSRIGLGCAQVGAYCWGKLLDGECVALVHRALELGLTLFDTADMYGFGRSEELLGGRYVD